MLTILISLAVIMGSCGADQGINQLQGVEKVANSAKDDDRIAVTKLISDWERVVNLLGEFSQHLEKRDRELVLETQSMIKTVVDLLKKDKDLQKRETVFAVIKAGKLLNSPDPKLIGIFKTARVGQTQKIVSELNGAFGKRYLGGQTAVSVLTQQRQLMKEIIANMWVDDLNMSKVSVMIKKIDNAVPGLLIRSDFHKKNHQTLKKLSSDIDSLGFDKMIADSNKDSKRSKVLMSLIALNALISGLIEI